MSCLSSCKPTDSRFLWIYEPIRKSVWSANGFATTPEVRGDLIVYASGYPWHNELFAHVVERKTGKPIWSSDFPVQQTMVDGDKVFLVSLSNFADRAPGKERKGKIYAMSLSTGKKIWELETSTNHKEVQILSIGKWLYCLTNQQTVSAVNKETGKIEWQDNGPEFRYKGASSSCIAAGDAIYLEQPDRSILKVDGKTKSIASFASLPRQKYEGKRVLYLDDDDVLIADDGGYAICADFNARSVGKVVRTGSLSSKVAIQDNRVYFGSFLSENGIAQQDLKGKQAESNAEKLASKITGKDKKATATPEATKSSYFSALDLESGSYLWNVKLNSNAVGTPVVIGDKVFVSTEAANGTSSFVALEKESGKTIWQSKFTVPIVGFIVHDLALYANLGNHMKALDCATGKELLDVKIERYSMSGQPVVVGNVVYVAAEDSNLYAISADVSR